MINLNKTQSDKKTAFIDFCKQITLRPFEDNWESEYEEAAMVKLYDDLTMFTFKSPEEGYGIAFGSSKFYVSYKTGMSKEAFSYEMPTLSIMEEEALVNFITTFHEFMG